MFLKKKIQKLSRNYLLQFSLKMKQLTDTWCTHQIAFNHSNLNLTWILRFVLKLSGALHQNVFRISSSRYSTVQRGHIRLTQKRLSEIAKKKKNRATTVTDFTLLLLFLRQFLFYRIWNRVTSESEQEIQLFTAHTCDIN